MILNLEPPFPPGMSASMLLITPLGDLVRKTAREHGDNWSLRGEGLLDAWDELNDAVIYGTSHVESGLAQVAKAIATTEQSRGYAEMPGRFATFEAVLCGRLDVLGVLARDEPIVVRVVGYSQPSELELAARRLGGKRIQLGVHV